MGPTSVRLPSARYISFTFISFLVSVPVLSEQITLAQPIEENEQSIVKNLNQNNQSHFESGGSIQSSLLARTRSDVAIK